MYASHANANLPGLMAVVSLACAALAGSCSNPNGAGSLPGMYARSPRYHWGYFNVSGVELDEVRLGYDANGGYFNGGCGVLGSQPDPADRLLASNGGAVEGPGFDPIPTSVKVTWRTPDHEPHQVAVEIGPQADLVRQQGGILWLKFLPDGTVRLVAESTEMIHRVNDGLPPRANQRGRESLMGKSKGSGVLD